MRTAERRRRRYHFQRIRKCRIDFNRQKEKKNLKRFCLLSSVFDVQCEVLLSSASTIVTDKEECARFEYWKRSKICHFSHFNSFRFDHFFLFLCRYRSLSKLFSHLFGSIAVDIVRPNRNEWQSSRRSDSNKTLSTCHFHSTWKWLKRCEAHEVVYSRAFIVISKKKKTR